MTLTKFRNAFLCAIFSLAGAFLFILFFSLITYNSDSPEAFRTILGVLPHAVSGILASLLPKLIFKEEGTICPITAALINFGGIIILSDIVKGDGSPGNCILKTIIFILFFSGTLFLISRPKKRRHTRRR